MHDEHTHTQHTHPMAMPQYDNLPSSKLLNPRQLDDRKRFRSSIFFKDSKTRASKIAKQAKALATKPDNLSFIPQHQEVESGN